MKNSPVSIDINQAPWLSAIWNPTKHRIVGGKSERALIAAIISHSLGLKINLKVRELKQKYRDTIGDQKASLIPPIDWSGRPLNTLLEYEENESTTETESENL